MPLNQQQVAMISRAIGISRALVETLKPQIEEVNVVFNSAGGLLSGLKQADLDALPQFSGLTVQQLQDGSFALTGPLLGDLNNSLSALIQLATRA